MNQSFDPSRIPLRDIHLPDAIFWWPPAVGWWALAAAALLITALLLVRYVRHRPHRAALRALNAAVAALRFGEDPAACAQAVSTVVRRFAMTQSPDSNRVAGLVGEEWLDYLDGHWDGNGFMGGRGRCLLSAPYQSLADLSPQRSMELVLLCRAWVKAQPPGR